MYGRNHRSLGVLTVFRNTVENHLPFPSFFDIMTLIRLRLVCASYFYPGVDFHDPKPESGHVPLLWQRSVRAHPDGQESVLGRCCRRAAVPDGGGGLPRRVGDPDQLRHGHERPVRQHGRGDLPALLSGQARRRPQRDLFPPFSFCYLLLSFLFSFFISLSSNGF